MVDQLHHKWNAERDPQRGSDKGKKQISLKDLNDSKVTLKQNKPR
jgi:hypothetical protein